MLRSFANQAMHVRNVRTDKELLTLLSYITLVSARRGAAGFHPSMAKTAQITCASRGLNGVQP